MRQFTSHTFARSAVEWAISNLLVTTRSMELLGEGNPWSKGVEVEVQVTAYEVDMVDMVKARMWRSKDMRRCWSGKSAWEAERVMEKRSE